MIRENKLIANFVSTKYIKQYVLIIYYTFSPRKLNMFYTVFREF